jgi:hypothetical protein
MMNGQFLESIKLPSGIAAEKDAACVHVELITKASPVFLFVLRAGIELKHLFGFSQSDQFRSTITQTGLIKTCNKNRWLPPQKVSKFPFETKMSTVKLFYLQE